ncbi:hypothetical protein RvY_09903 [Ramazzottius varieornatus]|uniref:Uncharacterized protein n=1 Tax=Ramazzottius varieornatus TaxID=947166 RepID=A0A1D1VD35_RAMVA|nr:hypothetical protein RvY_09903 [Ramazzottius varieornatus]
MSNFFLRPRRIYTLGVRAPNRLFFLVLLIFQGFLCRGRLCAEELALRPFGSGLEIPMAESRVWNNFRRPLVKQSTHPYRTRNRIRMYNIYGLRHFFHAVAKSFGVLAQQSCYIHLRGVNWRYTS